jgi:hypothetical protein
MALPPEFDYTVVLVFPGFGVGRENAEAVVESALALGVMTHHWRKGPPCLPF